MCMEIREYFLKIFRLWRRWWRLVSFVCQQDITTIWNAKLFESLVFFLRLVSVFLLLQFIYIPLTFMYLWFFFFSEFATVIRLHWLKLFKWWIFQQRFPIFGTSHTCIHVRKLHSFCFIFFARDLFFHFL